MLGMLGSAKDLIVLKHGHHHDIQQSWETRLQRRNDDTADDGEAEETNLPTIDDILRLLEEAQSSKVEKRWEVRVISRISFLRVNTSFRLSLSWN